MRLVDNRDRWDAGRLLTLSDGVFAIVMTLMVLDIRITAGLDHDLFIQSLKEIWRNILYYFLSFLVLAKIWIGHHCRFAVINRVDRTFVGLSLASLALVALVPALTNLIGDYPHEPLAAISYCGLFFLIGAFDFFGWEYATGRGRLLDEHADPEEVHTWTYVRLVLPMISLVCIGVAIVAPADALLAFLGLTLAAPLISRTVGKRKPS